jgi:hypothetical protein
MTPSFSSRRMRFQQGVGVRRTSAAISASESEASRAMRRRIARSVSSMGTAADMMA